VVSGGKETTTSSAPAPQQTQPAKPATNEGTQKAPRLKPVGGASAGGNYSPNTSYMSRYPYSN